MPETNPEARRKALAHAIIMDYHTTRMRGVDPSDHVLDCPRTNAAFAEFETALSARTPSAGAGEMACRVCRAAIPSAELCDKCAQGNDPFVQSKYGDGRP